MVLGILCNVLVCAGVMCSLCGKGLAGRAIGAFVPVSFFVIGGFEHCVANMFYFSMAGLWGQAHTWVWLLIMTLGNAVGGLLLPLCRIAGNKLKGETNA